MGWNLGVILTCISLMAKNAENFFLHLLTIYICFGKYLFNLFTNSLVEIFILLLLIFGVLYKFSIF
jgi:hypothetical protein